MHFRFPWEILKPALLSDFSLFYLSVKSIAATPMHVHIWQNNKDHSKTVGLISLVCLDDVEVCVHVHVETVDEALAAYKSTESMIKYSHLALTGIICYTRTGPLAAYTSNCTEVCF